MEIKELQKAKEKVINKLPDDLALLFSLSNKHQVNINWHSHGFRMYLNKNITKNFLNFDNKAVEFKKEFNKIACDVLVVEDFLIIKRKDINKNG